MIEVININKQFNNKTVLSNINAVFYPGKVNMVIGKSGSGKTVLLKTLVGLHDVDSGSILFDKREFTGLRLKQRAQIRKEFGMLFQGSALFDSLTIEENVRFPIDLFTNMTKAEQKKRVDFCLERVNLTNVNNLLPSQVSGGMQKRAAIARAIALNPRYLFCDEPNSGLDPQTAIVIDGLIREITYEYGITTVINTHDINSVLSIADYLVFVYQGKSWWTGSRDDLFKTDNAELNDFLFSSKIMQGLQQSLTKNN